MVDEGKTLLQGEEETCEKNISESEDDNEEYVAAPIGKIAVVSFIGICFVSRSRPLVSSLKISRRWSIFLHCCYTTTCTARRFQEIRAVNARSLMETFKSVSFCTFQTNLGPLEDGFATDFWVQFSSVHRLWSRFRWEANVVCRCFCLPFDSAFSLLGGFFKYIVVFSLISLDFFLFIVVRVLEAFNIIVSS